MKKIIIEIPDDFYEKAMKISQKLNITFDELCARGVKELAEEHLEDKKENEFI